MPDLPDASAAAREYVVGTDPTRKASEVSDTSCDCLAFLAGVAWAVERAAQEADSAASGATIAGEKLGASWAEYIAKCIRRLLPTPPRTTT